MFTDINLFKIDQQKFYDELREINNLEAEDKDKKSREINDKFRDKIRKYLPTCLNIINTNFGCQFSLYKVGKDFNAAFKVIETNVKKSREEVEGELTVYRNTPNYFNSNETTKEQIDLACEILTTYVDDSYNVDVSKLEYLERTKAKTSSIITNVPRMSQEALSSASDTSSEIQYNPYAGIPVNLDDDSDAFGVNASGPFFNNDSQINNSSASLNLENTDAQDNSNFSMDIFY